MTGNVMVDRKNLEADGNVVVDSWDCVAPMRAWLSATAGTQAWVQIGHAGALSTSPEPTSPSGVPYRGAKPAVRPSRALTIDEIKDVVRRFVLASAVARDAGCAGVEIHAAHGFLLNQFLSPATNQRTDDYGGSLENRMRLLLEIVAEVRGEVGGSFPIAVKLNVSDGRQAGVRWGEEEALLVCQRLAGAGIDLIELSGGDYQRPLMVGSVRSSNYFRDFACRLKTATDVPVMLTGGVRSVESMREILKSGIADMIGLARPAIVEPDVAKLILSGELVVAPGSDADDLDVMEMLSWHYARMAAIARSESVR